MKIQRWMLFLTALLLAACSVLPPAPSPTPTVTAPTVTPVPLPTATPSPVPLPTAIPSSPVPEPPADPGLDAEDVYLFPWPLYEGDRISAVVVPRLPDDFALPLTISLTLPSGLRIDAPVAPQGLDGRLRARFVWVEDAPSGVAATTLTFTLHLPDNFVDPDPADNVLTLSVPLLPEAEMPPSDAGATWEVVETSGFRLHYITGSAAERDLDLLVDVAESAYADVIERLRVPAERLDIYLMDRVIGQGGYASRDWVAVSYVDRRYSPVGLPLLLRHELTHRLDGALSCDGAPSLIREGLAVYVSGGHYRYESLTLKAAALVASGRYISLRDLTTTFYIHQHEIGYLEAGAVLEYLIETFSWDGLETLCRASSEYEGDDAQRLGAGLRALGYTGLADFESAWLDRLATVAPDAGGVALLDAELRLMDAMRDYQAAYDPGAHFLKGILFSPQEAVEQDIVADFQHRPRNPEAIALELLLARAQSALDVQDAALAETLVAEVERALAEGFAASPLASDAREIVVAALAQGYEPVSLLPEAGGYYILAVDLDRWPEQQALLALPEGEAWVIALTQPEAETGR